MSVSFKYNVPSSEKVLKAGTSYDHDVLEQTFGSQPWIFTAGHIPMLEAMARACRYKGSLYEEIAEKIMRHGEIKVWTEY